MESNEKSLWQVIKGYFNALPDKENEEETIQQISSGVAFHGSNLWVLVFAVFIASLGLNVNSTAVIIGAMLISPLMGPIIGMGLGVGINDLVLLKRSIKNYLVATGISVLTATLYFLITPLNEAFGAYFAHALRCSHRSLRWCCRHLGSLYKGKGQCYPWRCYCYSFNAAPMYSWIWTCHGRIELLFWSILSLFYQYGVYCFGNFHWCSNASLQAKKIHRRCTFAEDEAIYHRNRGANYASGSLYDSANHSTKCDRK